MQTLLVCLILLCIPNFIHFTNFFNRQFCKQFLQIVGTARTRRGSPENPLSGTPPLNFMLCCCYLMSCNVMSCHASHNTALTPPQHRPNTAPTPPQHRSNTAPTPPHHRPNTALTPPRHRPNTALTPQQRLHNTSTTPS
jgi:hypothetical protein